MFSSLISLLLLFVVGIIGLPLPSRYKDRWVKGNFDDESGAAYNQWLASYQTIVAKRQWNDEDAKAFIHHDEFNIADGLDVDLFIVNEMQLAGDPVRAVVNEMNKRRSVSSS